MVPIGTIVVGDGAHGAAREPPATDDLRGDDEGKLVLRRLVGKWLWTPVERTREHVSPVVGWP